MKITQVVLRNTFHNTNATVRVPAAICEPDPVHGLRANDLAWEWLNETAEREWAGVGRHGPAQRRLARVGRALCGMTDCMCGTYRPR
mgnify:CR=1 FL=1